MLRCPSCSHHAPEGGRICPGCGRELVLLRVGLLAVLLIVAAVAAAIASGGRGSLQEEG